MSTLKDHPLALAAILLAALATAVLLAVGVQRVIAWEDRAPVEGWMTPGFLRLAYGLEGPDLAGIIGLPEADLPREPLSRIAQAAGRDPAALVAEVEAAVLARQGTGG